MVKRSVAPTHGIAPDLVGLATPVADLHLLPGNPRRGDVPAVARSLDAFGQRKPIVARRADGVVVAGNHTLQAAQSLGWDAVAVVWVDDDDATAKAFALADNRTAELGGYDNEALADLIAEVQAADEALLAATGWDGADLDKLLADIAAEQLPTVLPGDPDEVPPSAPAKTVPGDVWLLGPHRLMCGDSTSPTDVDKLLSGAVLNLAFTSPPYAEQREYDASSGFRPISPDEYVDWFASIAANVAAHLADDGSWFVNIKEHAEDGQRSLYVKDLTTAHVRLWGWRFVDELVWHKDAVPGHWPDRFKNAWEPVFHFKRGHHIKFRPDNVLVESDQAFSYDTQNRSKTAGGNIGVTPAKGVGKGFARPSNVVRVSTRFNENGLQHPAAFPVPLVEWFVQAYTDPGDSVFDPFAGSGSTLIAAQQRNRIGYGMELSPSYCDIICARFQKHTGIKPIAEATGREHDFCEE